MMTDGVHLVGDYNLNDMMDIYFNPLGVSRQPAQFAPSPAQEMLQLYTAVDFQYIQYWQ